MRWVLERVRDKVRDKGVPPVSWPPVSWHPATCILRPASCDLHPATCILRPESCDLNPTTISGIDLPALFRLDAGIDTPPLSSRFGGPPAGTLAWVMACALAVSGLAQTRALGAPAGLRPGAAKVDLTPLRLPVIRNGGFMEAADSKIADPIHARAVVLDDGSNRLAIAIVDSCMMPREFCDQVKAQAARATGLRQDRILIAATHAHSAPSVMDYCLGSRADPDYTRYLPGKIVEALELAQSRLEPARAAWTSVDAGELTNVRRWILRTDKVRADPFGENTVRANMHPGHNHPDFIGPSGPKDPWLSLLSLQTAAGEPLALLANFSMHYFG